ncbi:MAG: RluA family pseudouridine synthase [Deltaproteobacteria bacterium]|nr:RluA family pseudouridine synthase [Deltaproteobacteria bacterium]
MAEKPAGIPTQPQTSPNPHPPPLAPNYRAISPDKRGSSLGKEGDQVGGSTFASVLAEQFPELKNVGGNDWGAVHRLDVETSGLVVFARNQKTYELLREQFSKNRVEKEYTALVEGVLQKPGKITWPIGPDPKSSKRVKVYRNHKEAVRGKAQEAVTVYKSVGQTQGFAPTTLLKITIKTGRRHQIRAHLAAMGHPIVGDRIYGGNHGGLPLHLHATRLKFKHPVEDRWVEVFSKPPFFF